MPYSIDFYTGTQVFQKDYSNVLQFDSKEDRDRFFDEKEHLTLEGTDFVHVSNDNTQITVTFDETYTQTEVARFDYQAFNYVRINYILVGDNGYNLVQKKHYYFVNSYEIVSSTSNRTVVRFYLSEDIWTNYQFGIQFRPSLVERKHMDRWTPESDDDVYYTPQDAIPQSNRVESVVRYRPDSSNSIFLIGSQELSVDSHLMYVKQTTTLRPTMSNNKIMWQIVYYTNNFGEEPDQQLVQIIPFSRPDSYTFSEVKPYVGDICKNQIMSDYKERTETTTEGQTTIDFVMNCSIFPTYQMIKSGILEQILRDEDDYQQKVYNIQIFDYLPIDITYSTENVVRLEWKPTGTVISDYNVEKSFQMKGLYEGDKVGTFRFFVKIPTVVDALVLKSIINGEFVSKDTYNTNPISFIKPVKPVSQTYNNTDEPMLCRQPVVQEVIQTADGSSQSIVPDILKHDMCSLERQGHRIGLQQTISFDGQKSGVRYLLCQTDISNQVDQLVGQEQIGFRLQRDQMYQDLFNDYFLDYSIKQRDIDREMMWVNIATGGLQDAGSTAISQGIGYRSNMERAEMQQIKDDFRTLNYPISSGQLGQERDAYQKYQKQAMKMSVIGGIQNYQASGIGTYMQQQAKEKSIMNQPQGVTQLSNWKNLYQNDMTGMVKIVLKVDAEQYGRYEKMFRLYGYHIGRVLDTIDIKSRTFFDYIKTGGACLIGPYNQTILQQLGMIFDNGVTIWHMDKCTEDDIKSGTYYTTYGNQERILNINEE